LSPSPPAEAQGSVLPPAQCRGDVFARWACGHNRLVLLVGRWALKFPTPVRNWRDFLYGLLNNINETHRSRSGNQALCPVLWSVPGGFLVVMPRVRVFSEEEYTPEQARAFAEANSVPGEHKADSYGLLNGRVVCVDYGW
jgi:hypothetical protein